MAKASPAQVPSPSAEWLEVQVVWVEPDQALARGSIVVSCAVRCPAGATIGDALRLLNDPSMLQALESEALQPAIFGELRPMDSALSAGDRIELLGPLHADPKTSRVRRAEVQRSRKGDHRWGRAPVGATGVRGRKG